MVGFELTIQLTGKNIKLLNLRWKCSGQNYFGFLGSKYYGSKNILGSDYNNEKLCFVQYGG